MADETKEPGYRRIRHQANGVERVTNGHTAKCQIPKRSSVDYF